MRIIGLMASMLAMMAAAGCHSGAAPPEGYRALFNGKNLSGWRGLAGDPPALAKMSDYQRAEAERTANRRMREHWRVVDGVLTFDGQGDNLCTKRDYGDFELLVDWRLPPGGDSGIYIRGNPQVQIWDNPIGSGGLYNNKELPSKPLAVADKPPGEWNTLRIRIIGDRVTVHMNDVLVVDDTPLENTWQRGEPLPASGSIELQAHGGPLEFRNIFIRTKFDQPASAPASSAAGGQ